MLDGSEIIVILVNLVSLYISKEVDFIELLARKRIATFTLSSLFLYSIYVLTRHSLLIFFSLMLAVGSLFYLIASIVLKKDLGEYTKKLAKLIYKERKQVEQVKSKNILDRYPKTKKYIKNKEYRVAFSENFIELEKLLRRFQFLNDNLSFFQKIQLLKRHEVIDELDYKKFEIVRNIRNLIFHGKDEQPVEDELYIGILMLLYLREKLRGNN